MLENLDKEVKLYKSWLNEADQLGQDENLLEIREPYDEKEENKWRKKHRERIKEEKMQKSNPAETTQKNDDDEDSLWQACLDVSKIYCSKIWICYFNV